MVKILGYNPRISFLLGTTAYASNQQSLPETYQNKRSTHYFTVMKDITTDKNIVLHSFSIILSHLN